MLKLKSLSKEDESSYYDMLDDFLSNGEHIDSFEIGYENRDFKVLLKRLEENEVGVGLKKDFAPNTTYYLHSEDGRLFGLFNLRHFLTPSLRIDGGHIGFAIRPSERGKRLSHEVLRQGLVIAFEKGLKNVMLSVNSGNYASIAVIEKQGGVLKEEKMIDGEMSRNYWIQLPVKKGTAYN